MNGAATASQVRGELPPLPPLPPLPEACLRSELPCDDELPCVGRYPHSCLAVSIPLWSQPLDRVRCCMRCCVRYWMRTLRLGRNEAHWASFARRRGRRERSDDWGAARLQSHATSGQVTLALGLCLGLCLGLGLALGLGLGLAHGTYELGHVELAAVVVVRRLHTPLQCHLVRARARARVRGRGAG